MQMQKAREDGRGMPCASGFQKKYLGYCQRDVCCYFHPSVCSSLHLEYETWQHTSIYTEMMCTLSQPISPISQLQRILQDDCGIGSVWSNIHVHSHFLDDCAGKLSVPLTDVDCQAARVSDPRPQVV